MESLTKTIDEKLSQRLPGIFSMVCGGFSTYVTHYLALFSTFYLLENVGFDLFLLEFSVMGNEARHDAEEHYNNFDFVLSNFGRSLHKFVTLIGDKFRTEKAFATLI